MPPLWAIASLADPYQQYNFNYGGPGPGQPPPQPEQTPVTTASYQQLLTQGFQPQERYIQTQVQQPVQEFQHHGITPILPSHVTAPEPTYGTEQTQIMPPQLQRTMSQVSPSQYGTPYESPEMLRYPSAVGGSRKRSPPEDYTYDYEGLQQLQAHATGASGQIPVELTPHGHHARLQPGASSYYVPSQRASPQHGYAHLSTQVYQPQTHHHHRLPNQPPPSKMQRTGYRDSPSVADENGPPSVVGQAGMPEPAPRPKGPKLKFTAEDDALLVELKETKNLTWKQIADFLPGRSSGTLQVRYCTKLKAKTTVWTDEMVLKLRTAVEEYDNERWRIISGKVGNGFSAAACKEKAAELDTADVESVVRSESPYELEATRQAPQEPYPRATEAYDLSRGAEGS
ncbi:hypothetical protein LTR36_005685 [Oleoguttula mirabilis]|uniref:Myb-like domain-containing protein n=1 Tax=Oleoguttula mirabilis TaxID=1507867 RepID=A0AAV9JDH0_9PEZI|nr:hypothetical protein LTR36_005685 [Oleoguttula mirabilis]